ncbi:Myb/SANT-like DNA-binding domain [Trinorchestia longiramus]|nr:Myb/SANT-like DNA-binding domain [Trinorchestia longiramus]
MSSMIKNENKASSPLLSDKADIQNSLISDTANYFEDFLLPDHGKNLAPEHRHSKKNGCKKRWFTAHEKSVLQRLVLDNESVILSRRNDGVSVHLKKEVWLGIAEKFNSHPQTLTQRNSVELRRCWENMKFKAKKTLHRVQRHIEAARASSQCLGLPFTAGSSPSPVTKNIIGLADVFSARHLNNVVENSLFDDSTACLDRVVDASSNMESADDLETALKTDEQVDNAAYTNVSVFNSSSSVLSISPFFCLPSVNPVEDANQQSRDSPVLPSPPPKSESLFVAPLNLSCDAPCLAPDIALKTQSSTPCNDTSLNFQNISNESLKNSLVNGISIQPHSSTEPAVESDMIVDHDGSSQLPSLHGNQHHQTECTSPSRVLENRPSQVNVDSSTGVQKSGDVLQRVTAPPILPAMSALFSVLEGQTLSVMSHQHGLDASCLRSFLPFTAAPSDAVDVCLDLSKKSCAHRGEDVDEHLLDNADKMHHRNVSSPKLAQDSGCTENNGDAYVLCEDAKHESENKKLAFNLNNIYLSCSPFGLDIPSLSSCFGSLSGTDSFRLADSTSNAALASASMLRSLLSSGTSRTLLRAGQHNADRLKTDSNWTSSVPPRVMTGKSLICEGSMNNFRHVGEESLFSHRLLKTLNNISNIVPEDKSTDPVHSHQNTNKYCGEEPVNAEGLPSSEPRLVSEHMLAENIVFENTLLYQRLRLLQEQLQEVSGEHLQKMRLMQEEHRERLALFHEELSMKRMACQVMLEKALRAAK